MLKNQIVFLVSIFSISTAGIYDKNYGGALQEIYFGRNPSTMSEALGKGGVALSNGIFSPFYNPACLALNQGLVIGGSYADPYYLENNASYTFGGLSYTINDIATIGLQTNNFNVGEKSVETDSLCSIINSFYSRSSFYTLTLSTELLNKFLIGCNFSYVYDKKFFSGGATGFPIDIGIAKTIDFTSHKNINHSIIIGTSISNIFGAKISYIANEKVDLPVIFRIGSSYQIALFKTNTSLLHYCHFLSHFEYCDVLNSNYYTSYKWGSELSLTRFLLFRVGYYWQSENDYGFPNYNKNHLDDITYGLGLFLPFSIIKRNYCYLSPGASKCTG